MEIVSNYYSVSVKSKEIDHQATKAKWGNNWGDRLRNPVLIYNYHTVLKMLDLKRFRFHAKDRSRLNGRDMLTLTGF